MDGDQSKPDGTEHHIMREARRAAANDLVKDYPAEFRGESPIRVNKLGHIVYEVTDVERTAKFWKQVMGFHETDRNEHGMIFLRYGADHHSIGLKPSSAKGRPAKGEALKLEHLAFEVDTMDMLFAARDFMRDNNIPVVFDGRKGAGGNTSLHFLDPDGFEFEIYYKMDQIDEDGELRPEAQFRRAGSLEEAAANPLPPKRW